MSLNDQLGPQVSACTPAYAVAVLASESSLMAVHSRAGYHAISSAWAYTIDMPPTKYACDLAAIRDAAAASRESSTARR